ncbi:MAG TPA: serine/threonine-protein kinase, partial [Streptosporangiaceae bacterium]|nr:serine/threonine-protein kinase [Streptosporangiaceae bacterium]
MGDEIPPAFSEFSVGSQIAGYRLEEQIGRGGMAVVYRAYDARLDRRVALKILAPGLALDDGFRHRFIRESRAAAAVDHPNIIPVFDAGEASGVLFIAMRFVQGRDVRTLIDRTGPLPPARASDIIAQVASALDAAHARGLVHRDVKPANMLLDDAAGEDRQDHVYLSDFGLSKHSLSQTGITSQGQVLGTLDYIAPEQIEGRAVDGRTDLYALACATFELLSGAPPFKRNGGLAVVWAQLSEPPPPLTARRAGLPSAVDDVLARAMAKLPAERYRRCGEFAAALREALGLRPGERGRMGEREPPAPATQIAVLRADLPSGPAGEAPWVGEAAPAGAGAPLSAQDAAPAGGILERDDAVSADDATPPWGTPLP